MKFILTMVICSQVANTCIPPHQYHELFNNAYDCMIKGYELSKDKTIEIGPEEVNKYNIYIKFGCDAFEEIEKTPTSFDKVA
tara:strand:+ start:31 stop:276 length:246 start_codon:yes stop_codon:yes gene_type:complete